MAITGKSSMDECIAREGYTADVQSCGNYHLSLL